VTERHDLISAILGTSVLLLGLLAVLMRFVFVRRRNRYSKVGIQETALWAALRRQADLIRERDELREKLDDAETRCAILSAICKERCQPMRGESQTLR
jgi:hypothetical protein